MVAVEWFRQWQSSTYSIIYSKRSQNVWACVATFLERLDRLLAVRWAKCMERQKVLPFGDRRSFRLPLCLSLSKPQPSDTHRGPASSWGAAKHSTMEILPDLGTVAMDIWQMLLKQTKMRAQENFTNSLDGFAFRSQVLAHVAETYGETSGRFNLLNCFFPWRTCCLATMRMSSSTRTALHQETCRLFVRGSEFFISFFRTSM